MSVHKCAGAHGGQKGAEDPLELELQPVVSCLVGAGLKQLCSQPLSLLPSPGCFSVKPSMVPGCEQVLEMLLAGAAPVTVSEKLRKSTLDGGRVWST